jgi:amidase
MTLSPTSRLPDTLDYGVQDATALAKLVRRKEVSPRELVTTAIERIERSNQKLNAVIHTMFERALATADAPLPDGPFTGVPFLLKDLLSLYEGEPITSGSRLLRRFIAPFDTELVRRYRATGVIVLGKTNTPEFGLVPFTEPELFGPSRNPWDTSRTTGGSSGGSAAAVAARFVPMAGGGDGGGSIRIPASCCGIFGFKPTRGRVPTGPLNGELWAGAVTEHVLTRSVRDSAAMLDAVGGPEPGSPYETLPPERPFAVEARTAPGRLRIAFTHDPLMGSTIHADCRAALDDTLRLLELLGHEIVEATPPFDRESFNRAFVTIVCAETAADIADAARVVGRSATRGDVEATTWAGALLGRALTAADYAIAVRTLQRAARAIGRFFEGIDVLVTPTISEPPFHLGKLQPPNSERMLLGTAGALRAGKMLLAMGAVDRIAGSVYDFMPYTAVFNVTGQPAMSVPLVWNSEGLPIGMHFAGRFGDDATLFRLAAQLEEARPWSARVPRL